ncbi:MAG TPA: aminotransferase class I/II-fold pyridoxal phosphate-dependent enzyme [Chitinispirillaceae bacterium]|nr:aminotransferase class I/II-fold pyridoxal phosphate-dependent enzyme [Chitinispirillaceae bacterium]
MQHSGAIETVLAQAGLCSDSVSGAISTPIFQTATYGHPELGKSTGFDYSRTSNPTRTVLENVLAELETGIKASAFSSGMAALSSLQALFKPGDTILISDDLYGGTFRLFEQIFKPWDLKPVYCDFSDIRKIIPLIDSSVKCFFIETPTNPLMKITDIKKAAGLARSHNILTIVDNTFMTPYCQKPLCLGADIVIHSGTKFLAGHNDTLFGAVISKDISIAEKIAFYQNSTGAIASPFDSWLAIRGIKTLAVRLDRAQANASKIAAWLQKRHGIKQVYFPALSTHPGRLTHYRQSAGPGAVISFRVADKRTVKKIINKVDCITFAESLGGVESLITYPLTQTHEAIPEKIRKTIGITDDLLRLSVGIESYKDLIADLDQAIG